MKFFPEHLSLGQVIEALKAEPDKSRIVPLGFGNPHSYRGNYMDLAFEVRTHVTIREMLTAANDALNQTYTGWKGGEYEMREWTDVHLVTQEGDCGESLGRLLLTLLLKLEKL